MENQNIVVVHDYNGTSAKKVDYRCRHLANAVMSSKHTESIRGSVDRVITAASKLDYDKDHPIANTNGGFLLTYKAQHREWGMVAYKKLKVMFIKEHEGKKLKKEAAIQLQLHHPSIVTLVGMVYESENYGLVLEYMKYGEVTQFMKDFKQVHWAWKLQMINDVILGMNYLHTQKPPIVHGDLTSRNVLVGDGFKVKITDFGFSDWKDYSRSLSKDNVETGTVTHVPPENWASSNHRKNEKYDVYGFGIVVWEILTELQPYDEKWGAREICDHVQKGDRPNLNSIQEIKDAPGLRQVLAEEVIRRCWNGEYSSRPTFSALKTIFDRECPKYKDEIAAGKKMLNDQELERQRKSDKSQTHSSRPTEQLTVRSSYDKVKHEDIKNNIINNYVNLVKNLQPKDVLDYLVAKEIINEEEYELIMKRSTRADKCRLLLDKLIKKPKTKSPLNIFLSTLESTEQKFLSDMLVKTPDVPMEIDSPDEVDGGTTNNSILHKVIDMRDMIVTDVNPVEMMDYLFQEKVLTIEEKNKFLKKMEANTDQEICCELLMFLLFSKNDRAFIALRKALQANNPGLTL